MSLVAFTRPSRGPQEDYARQESYVRYMAAFAAAMASATRDAVGTPAFDSLAFLRSIPQDASATRAWHHSAGTPASTFAFASQMASASGCSGSALGHVSDSPSEPFLQVDAYASSWPSTHTRLAYVPHSYARPPSGIEFPLSGADAHLLARARDGDGTHHSTAIAASLTSGLSARRTRET